MEHSGDGVNMRSLSVEEEVVAHCLRPTYGGLMARRHWEYASTYHNMLVAGLDSSFDDTTLANVNTCHPESWSHKIEWWLPVSSPRVISRIAEVLRMTMVGDPELPSTMQTPYTRLTLRAGGRNHSRSFEWSTVLNETGRRTM
jgi:hypothetical protein